jgi:hypothetical protein
MQAQTAMLEVLNRAKVSDLPEHSREIAHGQATPFSKGFGDDR